MQFLQDIFQVISNCFVKTTTILTTLSFADMMKDLPPLADHEEYLSNDMESLFTSIPFHETVY